MVNTLEYQDKLMSNISCGICKSLETKKKTFKRSSVLYQCKCCGVFFVWPQPDRIEIEKLYSIQDGYFLTSSKNLEITSSESSSRLDNYLMSLGIKRGRLLDIGCATGQLLFHLDKYGWKCVGIDINGEAIEIAKENGIDAFKGTLDSIRFPINSFDVVNMGDIIEHVCSPNLLIQQIKSILVSGGYVSIRTPNSQCGFSLISLFFLKYLICLGFILKHLIIFLNFHLNQ